MRAPGTDADHNGAPADDLIARSALDLAFSEAGEEVRAAVAVHARVVRLQAAEFHFHQGDPQSVAVVARGIVGLQRELPDGREIIARVVRPGSVFGLPGLIHVDALVGAVALSDAIVVDVPVARFRPLLLLDAGLATGALQKALAAIIDLTERIDTLVYQNAETRVARVLHRFQDLWFDDPPTLLRRHLPMMVGTSREMAGRALRRLEERGVVVRAGAGLQLGDAAALERVAHPAQREQEPEREARTRSRAVAEQVPRDPRPGMQPSGDRGRAPGSRVNDAREA